MHYSHYAYHGTVNTLVMGGMRGSPPYTLTQAATLAYPPITSVYSDPTLLTRAPQEGQGPSNYILSAIGHLYHVQPIEPINTLHTFM